MELREQATYIMNRLRENKPNDALKNVAELDNGMRLVLMLLSESNKEIYASTISDKMCISRARVAVLLKKMEAKNYILKNPSSSDARIEVVSLAPLGRKVANNLKEEAILRVCKLIKEIGFDEINHFIDIASKIKKIMQSV